MEIHEKEQETNSYQSLRHAEDSQASAFHSTMHQEGGFPPSLPPELYPHYQLE